MKRPTISYRYTAGLSLVVIVIVCALTLGAVTVSVLLQNTDHNRTAVEPGLTGSIRPLTTSVATGIAPTALAYDSGKGEVFVTNYGSNNVSVFNVTTDAVVANIPVGSAPTAAAYDQAKGEIFVSNWGSANVTVINDTTDAVAKNIAVGSSPDGVAYDPAKGEIFVANKISGNLSVINDTSNLVTSSIAMPIGPSSVPDYPFAVAYDSEKGELFVAASEIVAYPTQYELALVFNDTNNTLTANVKLGNYSDGTLSVAYDGARGQVFFTVPFSGESNEYSGTIVVVSDSSNSVVTSVGTTLDDPDAVGYDSGTGEVFAGNYGQVHVQSNVSVIDDATDTITATIPVGIQPDSVAYDPVNGNVFVANNGGNNVTVIGPTSAVATYGVTFTESGLAAGTNWSVTLDGAYEGSTLTTIQFTEPNGSYTFSVGPVAGYTPNPTSGPATVSGSALALRIVFTSTAPGSYRFSVTETGLPSGTNWSVTIAGTIHYSEGTMVEYAEPNGTYHYEVGSVSGYTVSPAAGEFNITGVSVNVNVAFTTTSSSPPPSSPSSSGLSNLDYGIIGAVFALLLIIVVLLIFRRRKGKAPESGPAPSPATAPGIPPPPA